MMLQHMRRAVSRQLVVRPLPSRVRSLHETRAVLMVDEDVALDDSVTPEVETQEVEIPDDLKKGSVGLDKFDLSEATVLGLKKMGINDLFPVQAETFDVSFQQEKDVLCRSRTGSGKTLAFALPIIERLYRENPPGTRPEHGRSPRALVLAPTRELAAQVGKEFDRLSSRNVATVVVYGGAPFDRQAQDIRKGVDVVVGTPGRLIDHLERGTLRLDELAVFVLDEADTMLKFGFKEDVERILQEAPPEDQRQSLMYSATVPHWVRSLAKRYMRGGGNTTFIDLSNDDSTSAMPASVKHQAIIVPEAARSNVLLNFLTVAHQEVGSRTIVFTDTKVEVANLTRLLGKGSLVDKEGMSLINCLHGDMSQRERTQTLNDFRNGRCAVLVCTDVAARGLDIPAVQQVIHFRLPKERDTDSFVHRSGRTGRAGASGTNLVICDEREIPRLSGLQRELGFTVTHISAPTPDDVLDAAVGFASHTLKSVRPAAVQKFVSAAEELLEQQGPRALAAALATIAGQTGQSSHRGSGGDDASYSMLTGRPGWTTLLLHDKATRRGRGWQTMTSWAILVR